MKYVCVIIVLCVSTSESQSVIPGKLDSLSLTKANTTEQKVWNIKLDINFSKSLPSIVSRPTGSDVRLKCEAFMNFTRVEKYTKSKEKIETSLKEVPPEHILQTLMSNVKVYWLRDDKQLEDSKAKISTKIDKSNGTIATTLRIRKLSSDDEGSYSCVIKQNHEKKLTTKLEVNDDEDSQNYEIPTYASLFPDSPDILEASKTTQLASDLVSKVESRSTVAPAVIEPICQQYSGRICKEHLSGHFVYIPFNATQANLEEKLIKAVQVTRYSNDISSQCEGYALPSLCYSTFPICRNPLETNKRFFEELKEVLAQISDENRDSDDAPKIVFENIPVSGLPVTINTHVRKNATEVFNYRHNSTILRRVCKQECEILENELCQTEYAIAKRHPHIGQQITLEECHDLPEDDPECLKIGVGEIMVSDDKCYWETGVSYFGKVNLTDDGSTCIEWFKQLHVKVSEHRELTGRHNYCRNPGGLELQPWCVVERDGKNHVQFCDIPKCAHKIWIYIVIVFLLLTLTVIGFIICLCFKNKSSKNSPAAIRDINLPTDKNIYGNSRLNSPIEMNELLATQNHNNAPHLHARPVRGNGALRVPQYSLSQIKFLEELGEGAFGKVYKGALKMNGETQYVAVKALKENASAKTQSDFRREIDLISELRHDNIVCIVGVALREEPLCMLFEFMARGDLHEFLMGRAPPAGKGLPALRLLNISYNIAAGMHYLASHHYVHRDLAARNCLVSDDFVVKISDFGLSRDIYSSDYYRVQSKSLLPVRWMPPESILYGKFTTESDIWSYGVVLWEIYSYGLQPYYGYSNQEVISMVRGGELLAPPAACPRAVYALMRECWGHAPPRRPKFDEIVARLQSWIEAGGCPEPAPSESGSSCGHRASTRDLQERVPLLPPHFSSNGSLTSGSLRKLSVAGSSKADDNRSVCSEAPPIAPKKKGSSGSLIDTDKARDTVVRLQSTQFGNDI
ncbi:tyrosine-protein kinase transmembrane receptor Ror [Plutella xylostella]|uniref:tyrosine-protein kinase transmembrane receptor Ror n=1 Tax=Plutella xylostella TaxID=51655 RepID=UPI0020327733|nr:tyrosine-protein kinase transmembrane receptor Ror [Plutella xylostella]